MSEETQIIEEVKDEAVDQVETTAENLNKKSYV